MKVEITGDISISQNYNEGDLLYNYDNGQSAIIILKSKDKIEIFVLNNSVRLYYKTIEELKSRSWELSTKEITISNEHKRLNKI